VLPLGEERAGVVGSREGCNLPRRSEMPKESILQFEYSDVLDSKTRELCALAAAAAGGCGH
jgi:alkylhydroperoxidase/carboxymuconolactone decarboxylase family protein YurZ